MASQIPRAKFREVKPIVVKWKNFAKGLNTLVAPTKIRDDELSVATNVILKDEGAPTRRPGTSNYGNTSGNTGTYGIFPYYKSDGTHKLLKLEGGFLKEYNSVTENWSIVSGGSFSSGIRTSGVMAFDTLYLSNGTNPLSKYDGSGISVFSELSAPTSNWVSRNSSLASGQFVYSYRISAVNAVGETLAAAAATIPTARERSTWQPNYALPNADYGVTVRWNKVTGASGYNIYGVTDSDETYLDHVDGQGVDTYIDYGMEAPSNFFTLPVGNSTGGPKGQYILEFKSSLIIGGDITNPSRVHFSAGTADKIDSFLISDGGGWIDISKNSNDGEVTGLAKYQNKVVIFKRRSVWQMDFTEAAIPSITNVVNDIGCVSHYTIANVENDLYFLGRKIGGGAAIYVLGNEPNFLNVLRTNELSARVRPTLQAINSDRLDDAVAVYYDAKYHLFYTEGGSTKNDSAIVYDRERLGFTKWSSIYVDYIAVYYDESEDEYLLAANGNDNRLTRISSTFTDDKGSAITWNIKTKESDLEEPFLYKKYKWVNIRLKDVQGTIRIKVWTDSIQTAYTNSISADTADTAFGSWQFGQPAFGSLVDTDTEATESIIIRRIPISREGTVAIARSLALEIYGETDQSKATLLDVTIEARPKSKNFYPREEVITS